MGNVVSVRMMRMDKPGASWCFVVVCSPMWHIPFFPIPMLVLICICHNLYLLLYLS